jgi:hypothetical protein
MAGHSRLKDGVALLAYVPAISIHVARFPHGNRDHRVSALRAGPVMTMDGFLTLPV